MSEVWNITAILYGTKRRKSNRYMQKVRRYLSKVRIKLLILLKGVPQENILRVINSINVEGNNLKEVYVEGAIIQVLKEEIKRGDYLSTSKKRKSA